MAALKKYNEATDKTQALRPAFERLKPDDAPRYLGDTRFAQLLGAEKWKALPLAVRKRFGKRVRHGESCLYQGYVVKTEINFCGVVLAQALRLLGAPLPLDTGNIDKAAVVIVTEEAADGTNAGGQIWSRQYARRRGFPQIIQSAKRFSGPTGLEEYVGRGLGMTLILAIEDEALLFKSDRYFVQIMGRRLYLPRALTPGALTVSHKDHGHTHGETWFEFGLTLKHKIFGTLFDQAIMFRDVEG